ncbi:hypothetical protein BJX62DRAFT_124673 [Aspergillus germanicus]
MWFTILRAFDSEVTLLFRRFFIVFIWVTPAFGCLIPCLNWRSFGLFNPFHVTHPGVRQEAKRCERLKSQKPHLSWTAPRWCCESRSLPSSHSLHSCKRRAKCG